jgi:CheY-like chemotaxis protein
VRCTLPLQRPSEDFLSPGACVTERSLTHEARPPNASAGRRRAGQTDCSLGARDMVDLEPLAGLTVLVVDDHYDTVEMLVEYLRAFGAIVIGLRTATAAMGYAMSARIDAVLVDLRMPGEDGRWLLRKLRSSNAPSAQAPVFVVSGESRDEPSQADGFAGYFLKPVNLDALVAALSALPRRPQ